LEESLGFRRRRSGVRTSAIAAATTAVEQAIADRTIEYAELGEQLREASAMLQLIEEQGAAGQHEIDRAAKRAKTARWLSLLAFIAELAFNYLVEWTAGLLKPPSLP
jgi:hypothetical protein